MDFVVVLHTEAGIGSSRAYGPFATQDEAVGSVPRIMSVNPDATAAEVVAVTPWKPLDTDPDFRVETPSEPVH